MLASAVLTLSGRSLQVWCGAAHQCNSSIMMDKPWLDENIEPRQTIWNPLFTMQILLWHMWQHVRHTWHWPVAMWTRHGGSYDNKYVSGQNHCQYHGKHCSVTLHTLWTMKKTVMGNMKIIVDNMTNIVWHMKTTNGNTITFGYHMEPTLYYM